MHFSIFGLISALLVSLVAGAPADLENRSDGSPIPGSPGASAPQTPRNLCSQIICPQFCASNPAKRSFETLDYNSLTKRWFEWNNADQFPYLLLDKPGTTTFCPDSGNSYVWKPLRTQYAAAIQGLCGCTTIIVTSANGVFLSHLWESDDNPNPRDLSLARYQATLQDLSAQLTPNRAALAGGEAFLIVPVDPANTDNFLYDPPVVPAISNTIMAATGFNSIRIIRYEPLDCKDKELGKTKRGTAVFQYDPAYTNANGQTSKAYRVISEGVVLSLKQNL